MARAAAGRCSCLKGSDEYRLSESDDLAGLHFYRDDDLDEALALCDRGTPYGLTGSVFARDPSAIARITGALRDAAVSSRSADGGEFPGAVALVRRRGG